jgi:hypothetical protein
MTQTTYNCTQPELYAVARTGWNSYTQYLAQFTDYRGYYLAAYATAALAEIDAAELLPDAQARYANSEVLRTELVAAADDCLARWQTLKRYISTSFAPAAIKPRLEEAGANRYEKAANYNWEELRMMNVNATAFIAAHTPALVLGNNMPLMFPTDYAAAITLYNVKMQAFIDSEEAAYNATEEKIAANNAVHAKLMNMFKDGQEIFMHEEGKRREFTFDTVLGLISSPGQAGIRGVVRDAATQLPIENADVRILINDRYATTDAAGRYEIKPLSHGYYDIRIVALGYADQVVSQHEVLTGTISTLDILLVPLP